MLVTVSDRRQQQTTDNSNVSSYTAEVITASDYYPFGMLMPNRSYYSDATTEDVPGSDAATGEPVLPSPSLMFDENFVSLPQIRLTKIPR